MIKKSIFGLGILAVCFALFWGILKGQAPVFLSKEAEKYLKEMNYLKVEGTPTDLSLFAASPKIHPAFFVGKLRFEKKGAFDAELEMDAVEWHVAQTLLSVKKEDVGNSFKAYIPYRDILKKPLESLVLSGFPLLKGQAKIKIHTSSQTGLPVIWADFDAENAFTVKVQIHLKSKDDTLIEQLISSFLSGRFLSAVEHLNVQYFSISTTDKGIRKGYENYLKQLPAEEVEAVKRSQEYIYFSVPENKISFSYNPLL